jgi:hypothetical protein
MILRVEGVNERASVSVGVWSLKAPWFGKADGSGIVLGNVTTRDETNSTALTPSASMEAFRLF